MIYNVLVKFSSEWFRKNCKINDEYGLVKNMPKEGGQKKQAQHDVIRPYGQQQWQG